MADASITARIGGDASGLVAALEQGKQAAGKFASDFQNVISKKLSFKDVFKAGCSMYGIGDLDALARDTHKFESRYLDSLIGPLPAAAAEYK